MVQLVKLVKCLPCENQDLSLVPRAQVKKVSSGGMDL